MRDIERRGADAAPRRRAHRRLRVRLASAHQALNTLSHHSFIAASFFAR